MEGATGKRRGVTENRSPQRLPVVKHSQNFSKNGKGTGMPVTLPKLESPRSGEILRPVDETSALESARDPRAARYKLSMSLDRSLPTGSLGSGALTDRTFDRLPSREIDESTGQPRPAWSTMPADDFAAAGIPESAPNPYAILGNYAAIPKPPQEPLLRHSPPSGAYSVPREDATGIVAIPAPVEHRPARLQNPAGSDVSVSPAEEISMLRKMVDQLHTEKISLELRSRNETERLNNELQRAYGLVNQAAREKESLASARADQEFVIKELTELQNLLVQAKAEKKQLVLQSRAEKEELSKELEEYKRQLDHARVDIGSFNQQVKDLEEQLEEARDAKQKTVQRSRADKQLLLKEMKDFKTQLGQMHEEKEQIAVAAQTEKEIFLRDAKAMEERLNQAQQQIQEMAAKMDAMAQQLGQAKIYKEKVLAKMKAEKAALTKEVRDLRNELAAVKDARKEAIVHFQNESEMYMNRIKELEVNVDQNKVAAEQLRSEAVVRLSELQAQIDDLHAETKSIADKLSMTETERREAIAALDNVQEVAGVQLGAIKRRFDALLSERNNMEAKVAELHSELSKAHAREQALSARLKETAALAEEKLQEAMAEADRKINEIAASADLQLRAAVSAMLPKDQAENRADAKQRVQDFQSQLQLELSKHDVGKIMQELKQARSESSEVQQLLAASQSEIAKLTSDLERSRQQVVDLQRQLALPKTDAKAYSQETEHGKSDQLELLRQLDSRNAEVARLSELLATRKREGAEVDRPSFAEPTARASTLDAERRAEREAAANAKITSLERRLALVTSERESLASRVQELERHISLESKLFEESVEVQRRALSEISDQKRAEYEGRIADLQRENARLEKVLSDTRAQLADLDSVLADQRLHISADDNTGASEQQVEALAVRVKDLGSLLADEASAKSSLRDRLHSLELQLSEAKVQLSESRVQLSEALGRLATSESRLSDNQARLAEAQARMAEAQAHLADSQAQLGIVQAQRNELQGELKEMQANLWDATRERNKMHSQLADIQAKYDAAAYRTDRDATGWESQRDALRQQLADLQTRLATVSSVYAQEMTDKVRESEDTKLKMLSVEDRFNKTSQELAEATKLNEDFRSRLSDAVRQLDASLSEKQTLVDKVAQLQARLAEKESMTEGFAQIESRLMQSVFTTSVEKQTLADALGQLEARLLHASRERDTIAAQTMGHLEMRLMQLVSEKSDLSKQKSELEIKLDKSTCQERVTSSRLTEAEARLQDAAEKIRALQADRDSLQQTNVALRGQVSDLDADLRTAVDTGEAMLNESEKRLNAMEEFARQLEHRIADLGVTLTERDDQIGSQHKQIVDLEKQIENMEQQIRDYIEEMNVAKSLRKAFSDKVVECERLFEEVSALTKEKTFLNELLQQFKEENATVKGECLRSYEECASLKQEISRLQVQLVQQETTLRAEIARLSDDNSHLRDEGIRLKDDCDRLQEEASDLKEESSRLKDDVFQLEQDLSESRTECGKLGTDRVNLRQEVEALKVERSDLANYVASFGVQSSKHIADLNASNEELRNKLSALQKRLVDLMDSASENALEGAVHSQVDQVLGSVGTTVSEQAATERLTELEQLLAQATEQYLKAKAELNVMRAKVQAIQPPPDLSAVEVQTAPETAIRAAQTRSPDPTESILEVIRGLQSMDHRQMVLGHSSGMAESLVVLREQIDQKLGPIPPGVRLSPSAPPSGDGSPTQKVFELLDLLQSMEQHEFAYGSTGLAEALSLLREHLRNRLGTEESLFVTAPLTTVGRNDVAQKALDLVAQVSRLSRNDLMYGNALYGESLLVLKQVLNEKLDPSYAAVDGPLTAADRARQLITVLSGIPRTALHLGGSGLAEILVVLRSHIDDKLDMRQDTGPAAVLLPAVPHVGSSVVSQSIVERTRDLMRVLAAVDASYLDLGTTGVAESLLVLREQLNEKVSLLSHSPSELNIGLLSDKAKDLMNKLAMVEPDKLKLGTSGLVETLLVLREQLCEKLKAYPRSNLEAEAPSRDTAATPALAARCMQNVRELVTALPALNSDSLSLGKNGLGEAIVVLRERLNDVLRPVVAAPVSTNFAAVATAVRDLMGQLNQIDKSSLNFGSNGLAETLAVLREQLNEKLVANAADHLASGTTTPTVPLAPVASAMQKCRDLMRAVASVPPEGFALGSTGLPEMLVVIREQLNDKLKAVVGSSDSNIEIVVARLRLVMNDLSKLSPNDLVTGGAGLAEAALVLREQLNEKLTSFGQDAAQPLARPASAAFASSQAPLAALEKARALISGLSQLDAESFRMGTSGLAETLVVLKEMLQDKLKSMSPVPSQATIGALSQKAKDMMTLLAGLDAQVLLLGTTGLAETLLVLREQLNDKLKAIRTGSDAGKSSRAGAAPGSLQERLNDVISSLVAIDGRSLKTGTSGLVESLVVLQEQVSEKLAGIVNDTSVLPATASVAEKARELMGQLAKLDSSALKIGASGVAETLLVLHEQVGEKLKGVNSTDKSAAGGADTLSRISSAGPAIDKVKELITLLSYIRDESLAMGSSGLAECLVVLREQIHEKLRPTSGAAPSESLVAVADVARKLMRLMAELDASKLSLGGSGLAETLIVLQEQLSEKVRSFQKHVDASKAGRGPAGGAVIERIRDCMLVIADIETRNLQLGTSGLAESLVVLREQLNDKLRSVVSSGSSPSLQSASDKTKELMSLLSSVDAKTLKLGGAGLTEMLLVLREQLNEKLQAYARESDGQDVLRRHMSGASSSPVADVAKELMKHLNSMDRRSLTLGTNGVAEVLVVLREQLNEKIRPLVNAFVDSSANGAAEKARDLMSALATVDDKSLAMGASGLAETLLVLREHLSEKLQSLKLDAVDVKKGGHGRLAGPASGFIEKIGEVSNAVSGLTAQDLQLGTSGVGEALLILREKLAEKVRYADSQGAPPDSSLGEKARVLMNALSDVESGSLRMGTSGVAEALVVLREQLNEKLRNVRSESSRVAVSSRASLPDLVSTVTNAISDLSPHEVRLGSSGLGEALMILRERLSSKLALVGSEEAPSSYADVPAKARELMGLLAAVEGRGLLIGAAGLAETLLVLREQLNEKLKGFERFSEAGASATSSLAGRPRLVDHINGLIKELSGLRPADLALGTTGIAESILVLKERLDEKAKHLATKQHVVPLLNPVSESARTLIAALPNLEPEVLHLGGSGLGETLVLLRELISEKVGQSKYSASAQVDKVSTSDKRSDDLLKDVQKVTSALSSLDRSTVTFGHNGLAESLLVLRETLSAKVPSVSRTPEPSTMRDATAKARELIGVLSSITGAGAALGESGLPEALLVLQAQVSTLLGASSQGRDARSQAEPVRKSLVESAKDLLVAVTNTDKSALTLGGTGLAETLIVLRDKLEEKLGASGRAAPEGVDVAAKARDLMKSIPQLDPAAFAVGKSGLAETLLVLREQLNEKLKSLESVPVVRAFAPKAANAPELARELSVALSELEPGSLALGASGFAESLLVLREQIADKTRGLASAPAELPSDLTDRARALISSISLLGKDSLSAGGNGTVEMLLVLQDQLNEKLAGFSSASRPGTSPASKAPLPSTAVELSLALSKTLDDVRAADLAFGKSGLAETLTVLQQKIAKNIDGAPTKPSAGSGPGTDLAGKAREFMGLVLSIEEAQLQVGGDGFAETLLVVSEQLQEKLKKFDSRAKKQPMVTKEGQPGLVDLIHQLGRALAESDTSSLPFGSSGVAEALTVLQQQLVEKLPSHPSQRPAASTGVSADIVSKARDLLVVVVSSDPSALTASGVPETLLVLREKLNEKLVGYEPRTAAQAHAVSTAAEKLSIIDLVQRLVTSLAEVTPEKLSFGMNGLAELLVVLRERLNEKLRHSSSQSQAAAAPSADVMSEARSFMGTLSTVDPRNLPTGADGTAETLLVLREQLNQKLASLHDATLRRAGPSTAAREPTSDLQFLDRVQQLTKDLDAMDDSTLSLGAAGVGESLLVLRERLVSRLQVVGVASVNRTGDPLESKVFDLCRALTSVDKSSLAVGSTGLGEALLVLQQQLAETLNSPAPKTTAQVQLPSHGQLPLAELVESLLKALSQMPSTSLGYGSSGVSELLVVLREQLNQKLGPAAGGKPLSEPDLNLAGRTNELIRSLGSVDPEDLPSESGLLQPLLVLREQLNQKLQAWTQDTELPSPPRTAQPQATLAEAVSTVTRGLGNLDLRAQSFGTEGLLESLYVLRQRLAEKLGAESPVPSAVVTRSSEEKAKELVGSLAAVEDHSIEIGANGLAEVLLVLQEQISLKLKTFSGPYGQLAYTPVEGASRTNRLTDALQKARSLMNLLGELQNNSLDLGSDGLAEALLVLQEQVASKLRGSPRAPVASAATAATTLQTAQNLLRDLALLQDHDYQLGTSGLAETLLVLRDRLVEAAVPAANPPLSSHADATGRRREGPVDTLQAVQDVLRSLSQLSPVAARSTPGLPEALLVLQEQISERIPAILKKPASFSPPIVQCAKDLVKEIGGLDETTLTLGSSGLAETLLVLHEQLGVKLRSFNVLLARAPSRFQDDTGRQSQAASAEIQELQRQLADASAQVRKASSELSSRSLLLSDMTERLTRAEQENIDLIRKVQEYEQDLSDATEQVNRLRTENARLLNALQSFTSSRRPNAGGLPEGGYRVEDNAGVMSGQSWDTVRRQSDAKSPSNAVLQRQVQVLEAKLSANALEVQRLEESLRRITSERDSTMDALNQQRMALEAARLHPSLDPSRSEAVLRRQVASLEQKLSAHQSEMNRLKSSLISAGTESDRLRKDLQKHQDAEPSSNLGPTKNELVLQKQVAGLEERLSSNALAVNRMQEALSAAEVEKRSLTEALQKSKLVVAVEAAAAPTSDAMKPVQVLQQQVVALEDRLAANSTEMNRLQEDLAKASVEKEKLNAVLDRQRVALLSRPEPNFTNIPEKPALILQRQVAQLEERLAQNATERNRLGEKIAEVSDENARLANAVANAATDREREVSSVRKQLEEQLDVVARDRRRLEREAQEYASQLNELQRTHAALVDEHAKFTSMASQSESALRAEVEAITAELKTITDQRNLLLAQKHNLNKEIDALKQGAAWAPEREALLDECKKLRESLTAESQKRAYLEDMAAALQTQNDKLMSNLQNSGSSLSAASSRWAQTEVHMQARVRELEALVRSLEDEKSAMVEEIRALQMDLRQESERGLEVLLASTKEQLVEAKCRSDALTTTIRSLETANAESTKHWQNVEADLRIQLSSIQEERNQAVAAKNMLASDLQQLDLQLKTIQEKGYEQQISSIRKQLEDSVARNDSLAQALRAAEDSFNESAMSWHATEKELRGQLTLVQDERRLLSAEREGLVAELKRLEASLRAELEKGLDGKLRSAQEQIADLSSNNRSLTEGLRTMSDGFNEASRNWADIESELRTQIANQESELKKQAAERDELSQQAEALEADLNILAEKYNEQKDNGTIVEDLRRQLQEASQKNRDLTELLIKAESDLNTTQGNVRMQEEGLQQQRRALELERESYEKQIAELSQEVETLASHLRAQDVAQAEMATKYEGLQNLVKIAKEDKLNMSKALEDATGALAELKREKNELESLNDVLRTELRAAHEDRIHAENARRDLEEMAHRDRQHLVEFEADVASKDAQIVAFEKQAQLAEQYREKAGKTVAALEEKLRVAEDERRKMERSLGDERSSFEQDRAALGRKIDALEDEKKAVSALRDEAVKKEMLAKEALAQARSENMRMAQALSESEVGLSSLQKQKEELSAQLVQAQAEREIAVRDGRSAKEQVTRFAEERAVFQATMRAEKEAATEKLQKELDTVRDAHRLAAQSLQDHLANSDKASRAASAELEKLRDAVQRLQSESDVAKAHLSSERARADALTHEKAVLSEQVGSLKAQMDGAISKLNEKSEKYREERNEKIQMQKDYEGRLQRTLEDLDSLRQSSRRDLEDKSAQLSDLAARLAKTDEALNDAVVQCRATKEVLTGEVKTLEDKLKAVSEARESDRYVHANEIEGVRREAKERETELNRLISDKEQEIAHERSQQNNLLAELDRLRGEMDRQADAAREEREGLEQEVATLESRLVKLVADKDSNDVQGKLARELMATELKTLEADLSHARDRIHALEETAEVTRREKRETEASLTAEKDKLQAELVSTSAARAAALSEVQKLSAQLNSFTAELDKLTREKEASDFQVRDMKDMMTKETNRAMESVMQARAEKDMLQRDLKTLESKLVSAAAEVDRLLAQRDKDAADHKQALAALEEQLRRAQSDSVESSKVAHSASSSTEACKRDLLAQIAHLREERDKAQQHSETLKQMFGRELRSLQEQLALANAMAQRTQPMRSVVRSQNLRDSISIPKDDAPALAKPSDANRTQLRASLDMQNPLSSQLRAEVSKAALELDSAERKKDDEDALRRQIKQMVAEAAQAMPPSSGGRRY